MEVCRNPYHDRIIAGELVRSGGKADIGVVRSEFFSKGIFESCVCGHATTEENRASAVFVCGAHCFLGKLVCHRFLKFIRKFLHKRWCALTSLERIEHCGLQSGKGKIKITRIKHWSWKFNVSDFGFRILNFRRLCGDCRSPWVF